MRLQNVTHVEYIRYLVPEGTLCRLQGELYKGYNSNYKYEYLIITIIINIITVK